MDKVDTGKVPRTLPRLAGAADVAKVLAVITSHDEYPRATRKQPTYSQGWNNAHYQFSGVSIEAVRRRLGHASTETTQRRQGRRRRRGRSAS